MKSLQMKKLAISTIAAAAMFASMSPATQAASQTSTFNVKINLTPTCIVSTAPSDITLNYTANNAAATGTTSVGVTCTTNLPATLSMNGVAGSGNYGAFTDASTGLNYTLSFTALGTGGADVAATGTGAEVVTTIGANIAASQWGTCASLLGCNNGTGDLQTVYINY